MTRSWDRFFSCALRITLPQTFCCAPLLVVILLTMTVGCASNRHPATRPAVSSALLESPLKITTVQSQLVPPRGWKPEIEEDRKEFARRTWIAPSGRTAYGVIRYDLPWPVGSHWALVGFTEGLKQSEGNSTIVERKNQQDGTVQALIDAGDYRMRCILWTRGSVAWVTYASTMKSLPIIEDELKLAELARDSTDVDIEQ